MKKYTQKILLFALVFMFSLVTLKVSATETQNKCEVDGGYYRVEETLEEMDLEYGLSSANYKHEAAYSAITSAERIIGNECGSAIYGAGSLDLNKEYTQSAHILTLKKDSNLKIVTWGVISSGTWNLSTILTCAKDYEEKHPGWKVIAGVNGDFFDINATHDYPYTVSGTMVSGGEILKVNSGWPCVAFKNDGSDVPLVKVDSPQHDSKETVYVYNDNGEIIYSVRVNKVNQVASENETSLWFGLYQTEGKSHNCVYEDVTDAYIVQDKEAVTVAYSKSSFYGKGKITSYGNTTLKQNQFAIQTNNPELQEYLKEGVTIRVQSKLTDEALQDATDVCGCVATFLANGEHVVRDHYDYMEYRFPRTLIGYTNDGSVVLAVTDGRQAPKGYYGLNGVESAAQMAYYGCTEAYSFDGGGSSTMVILKDGELTCVNSPSDGGLRRDGNAVLIVARVPEIKIDYTSKPAEITLMLEELEDLSGYDNYFVELNGQTLAIVDGKAKFTGLESNTSYKYQLYVQKGTSYNLMPYSGSAYTQKVMFEVNDLVLKEVGGAYQLIVDFDDPQTCILSSALLFDGTRVNQKKGTYTITEDNMRYIFSYSSKAKLTITYQLSENDERVIVEFDLDKIMFEDAEVGLDSIISNINSVFSNILG